MNRWTKSAVLWLAPGVVLSLALLGCSGDKKKGGGSPSPSGSSPSGSGSPSTPSDSGSGSGSGSPSVVEDDKLTLIKGEGTATITGKVTLEGDMPDTAALTKKLVDEIDKHKDKTTCLAGDAAEKTQQTWVINKDNKGVANVFVFLKPMDVDKQAFDVSGLVGKYKGKKVTVNQPHCAFRPHALLVFPDYVDPAARNREDWKKTGQVFEVVNDASIKHNTKWSGDKQAGVKPDSKTLDAKEHKEITASVKPSYNKPVLIQCDIHPWMNANAWVLEHPFAAVTDKDGNFKIENAPAGVKLRIVVWHEANGFVNTKNGEVVTLKKGDNPKNFEIKK